MHRPLHSLIAAIPFVNVRSSGARYGIAIEPHVAGGRRAARLSSDDLLDACAHVCANPASFAPAAFVTIKVASTLPAIHLKRALEVVKVWKGRPRFGLAIGLSDPRCHQTLVALAGAGGAALVSGIDAATRDEDLRRSVAEGATGACLSGSLVRELAAHKRSARIAVRRLCDLCNELALPVLAAGVDDSWTANELMALGASYLAGTSVAAPMRLTATCVLPARPQLSVRLPVRGHGPAPDRPKR